MKIQKKIVRAILALLPVLGMLFLFMTSFNAKTETYPFHSDVKFTDSVSDGTGWFTFGVPEAPNAKIIGTMYSAGYKLGETAPIYAESLEGAMLVLARFADNIRVVTGVPLTYILVPLWYAFYLFIIEMMFMVVDVVTFIPRKLGEFFGG